MSTHPLSWTALVATCCAGCLLWLACTDTATQGEPRSPRNDYGREPPRTSDDEIIGADGVPPGDKLQQGPRAGSDGLHAAPGWTVDKGGIRRHQEVKHPDPRARHPDGGAR